jgi:hypothetical protein
MRITFFLIILFYSYSCIGQISWSASFLIKHGFELGEQKTYTVSEFSKVDNIFMGFRATVESTVNFNVIDTADGGYWIKYTVNVNLAKAGRDSSVYIKATLTDGIQINFYAKNGIIKLDSLSYFKTKDRVTAALDSIANQQTFSKKNAQFIRYLQSELKKEEGLGILLGPMMIFEVYYSSQVYKKFRLNSDGISQNILKKTLFAGFIEKEWISTSKDSTVLLNYFFTGHPVAAAQYYKPKCEEILAAENIKIGRYFFPPEMRYINDYNFRTQPRKSFPSYMYTKIVSEYKFRSVNKIKMTEILNE